MEHGRTDLSRNALERVAYTDDGTTLYVHVLPKPAWSLLRAGRAYVLAFADKQQLRTIAEHRQLLQDALLLMYDEIGDIIRWFDGR